MYHTHNDECYYTPDGTDSVYGEGGIHDVGAKLKQNFNERENLLNELNKTMNKPRRFDKKNPVS